MSPNPSHIERYVRPSTPVAACQPRLPCEFPANSSTTGIADGSIIAAIITTQVAANDSSDPRPIAIPPVDLDCQIIDAHATAARARKASAVTAGGEISLPARPG
jgi:hypothetical protein